MSDKGKVIHRAPPVGRLTRVLASGGGSIGWHMVELPWSTHTVRYDDGTEVLRDVLDNSASKIIEGLFAQKDTP